MVSTPLKAIFLSLYVLVGCCQETHGHSEKRFESPWVWFAFFGLCQKVIANVSDTCHNTLTMRDSDTTLFFGLPRAWWSGFLTFPPLFAPVGWVWWSRWSAGVCSHGLWRSIWGGWVETRLGDQVGQVMKREGFRIVPLYHCILLLRACWSIYSMNPRWSDIAWWGIEVVMFASSVRGASLLSKRSKWSIWSRLASCPIQRAYDWFVSSFHQKLNGTLPTDPVQ